MPSIQDKRSRLGCLVLETGEVFPGLWLCGAPQAGETVFNTSHSGYEETATDPSYFSQILVMTAPMQGNYGASDKVWESDKIWIKGLVCLEMESGAPPSPQEPKTASSSPPPGASLRFSGWKEQLAAHHIPVLEGADTRRLTLRLREGGAVWGALLPLSKNSLSLGRELIRETKKQPKDWTYIVSSQTAQTFSGKTKAGPKTALIDFGCKKNILREILNRSAEARVFPGHAKAEEVLKWKPDLVFLSNGPGDPQDVKKGLQLTRDLTGKVPLFGICLGCQLLALAAGGKIFKLKFGHRGGNHPVKDFLNGKIYMAAHNHGYAVKEESLPPDVKVSFKNLNDGTVAGIHSQKRRFSAVQFHPESRPGPQESEALFDLFFQTAKGFRS